MTMHHNPPLYVAKEAQNLARNAGASDSLVFQKVATVSMCMVAVLTGMHMLIELWRDLHRTDRHQGRSR